MNGNCRRLSKLERAAGFGPVPDDVRLMTREQLLQAIGVTAEEFEAWYKLHPEHDDIEAWYDGLDNFVRERRASS